MSQTAPTAGLTPAEHDELLRLISKLEQPWPASIAEALLSILPCLAFECVILRRNPHHFDRPYLEVYLLERPVDDIHWAGQLHVPGTVMRAADQPDPHQRRPQFSAILDRLAQHELGLGYMHQPKQVAVIHAGKGGRANTVQFVYATVLLANQEPTGGAWFDVTNLPEDRLVGGHAEIIRSAVMTYGHRRTSGI